MWRARGRTCSRTSALQTMMFPIRIGGEGYSASTRASSTRAHASVVASVGAWNARESSVALVKIAAEASLGPAACA